MPSVGTNNDNIAGQQHQRTAANDNNNNNNNNNSNSTTNKHSTATTTLGGSSSSTPFRLTNSTPNSQNLIRPKPSTSFAAAASSYLASSANHRIHPGVSTSLNSSISSAFSSPSNNNKTYKNLNTMIMETSYPNVAATTTTTPRPISRQSTSGASSAHSASPPGSHHGNLQHLIEPPATVAVVPANNHTDPASPNQTPTNQPPPAQQQLDPFDPRLEYPTFDKADDVSDIILQVEGKFLHAHRVMLVLISPVFRAMFTGDFKESKENLIQLKGKRYDDVLEFLQCLYPPWKPISRDNVRILLQLADEYRVDGLQRRCEDFLLALKMARDTNEQRLWAYDQGQPFCRVNELLGLANTFRLERLSRALVDYLSPRPLAWQMDGPDFFAFSGPELENRILNKALSTALSLIDRNRYCETVKDLLSGHKGYYE